ncbi:MAG: ski2-like helicase [Pelotomaculum sp. PtaU1.Bin035]|nr:MAG: ski2-like helicase [Pelotomaculum sp. PtaU1.Bin035]
MPLEVVFSQCNCDYDALAGALSSLIEKEEVRIGRLKTKSGWLIGDNRINTTAGATWHTGRGQMRNTLPKILKELKKYAPRSEPPHDDWQDEGQFIALSRLLSDEKPRSRIQIIEEIGVENISPLVLRNFPRLPDGRYTLPDSSGAHEYFLNYLREKPRHLSDLFRLFRKHKGIITMLTAENNQDLLIRLPRALITTIDSNEGMAELERRRQLKLCKDTIETLPYPFFTPEELDLNNIAFHSIADSCSVTVKFSGKEFQCLRREFPGDVLVNQLRDLSGRCFTPPDIASAPAFLKKNSMGEKEAANILGIDEEAINHLIITKNIGYFSLDDRRRLWRSDIEELKRNGNRLRSLIKGHEKLNIPQAAALLGITTGQVRRLIDEGKIDKNPGAGYRLKRNDLEELQKSLPAILSGWNSIEKPASNCSESTEKEYLQVKKRPAYHKEMPLPRSEQLVLDHFQIEAAEALRSGHSVLLSAPTGNGKTLVAEMLARDLVAAGSGMVYTSPLKALSNQKYRDFREIFGAEAVGLVTGDISINPDAPLLIMTTEIFRNLCLGEPEQLKRTVYVVFDEIHYLDDTERGTTWEESILFAPLHIKILGLSATVPNIKEIADWIGSVRGEKVIVIEEKKRNVPLAVRWVIPSGRIVEESEARREVDELSEYMKALRNRKRWFEE